MGVLSEKREALAAKQKVLAAVFEEAGTGLDFSKVKSIEGDSTAKVAEVQRLNKELSELGDEVKSLAELERTAANVKGMGDYLDAPGGFVHPEGKNGKDGASALAEMKTIGDLFIEAKGHIKRGGSGPLVTLPEVDLKTTMSTTAGWVPEVVRGPRVELTPERSLLVSDLPMLSETMQAAVSWMKETTFTNNAVEKAEAATFGEAALALEEDSLPVRKIPVFLPVTDEQLEDVARIRDYINNRLTRMIRARLDGQIIAGDGIAPNLEGILASGLQTQALGTDTLLDCIYKGIVKVQHTGFSNPDGVVLHPNDWRDIRLARTADGIYVWGHPSETGREQVWGVPVVVTTGITEGTGVVGAWRDYSELSIRKGIEIQVSNSHDTYFTKGMQAIRADMRCAFIVYRPTAFCQLTGI